jgi:hypothetical protein
MGYAVPGGAVIQMSLPGTRMEKNSRIVYNDGEEWTVDDPMG